jgi:hypothetical protein
MQNRQPHRSRPSPKGGPETPLTLELDEWTKRPQRLLGDISDKKPIRDDDGKIHPKMVEWCNRLYDEISRACPAIDESIVM